MAAARIDSLDRLRGLIMVLMAVDHVSAFVARRHATEFWSGPWTQYDSAAWFLTRFVTHLCAPGFFFLMGAGIALLASSRRVAGWNDGRIARFLAVRGALLLVVEQIVANPAWFIGLMVGQAGSPVPGGVFLLCTVLTGLGLCILMASVLLRFGDAVWWIASAGALLGSALFMPGPEAGAVQYPALLRFLAIPGLTPPVFVLYPLVPWFGLTGLGVLFGRWIERNRAGALRAAPWIGAAMIAAALVLRAAGGIGNLRLPRDGSWIEFLNFIKYPPALVFSLFMVGANLILLRIVRGEWLAVFGKTPLFFYIAHLYLYGIVGCLFFQKGAELWALYAVWAAGLVPLWYACRWYARFKGSKPVDSIWRFF